MIESRCPTWDFLRRVDSSSLPPRVVQISNFGYTALRSAVVLKSLFLGSFNQSDDLLIFGTPQTRDQVAQCLHLL